MHWQYVRASVLSLLPVLGLPVALRLGDLIYPRLQLVPMSYRGIARLIPPSQVTFFREMAVVGLAAAFIFILQMSFTLITGNRGEKKLPWAEAGIVGGLFSLGVYGVLRGYQASPSDFFLFPLPALGMAILAWVLLSFSITLPAVGKGSR